jgi:hypothetical protein
MIVALSTRELRPGRLVGHYGTGSYSVLGSSLPIGRH